ncbi:DNA protecting protein DprA [Candidatus Woesebacteria bacterium RIFCSPLOWO2_01_FULL_39_61]|uniref:DNA protecting protein DprA n=1 Tax=Candidatus Woesebacteria bacterium RIFCSPHIGHO2_02_FULL_39_13 TaxID=1802505 RepID=A0A1F7Z2G2_9BACT|nr:MAG: DNA protecting protein DprA [Candidatus Woesebacteria bacterium RIFCSPHIGHO2_01_FULL_39_95]OGM33727.1 MAG: DNA protecting protein DprA [Candidatus Woesebacteria bacterium RIFCSPHIGHO2_02_FULL_39_13]OGM38404.1 MAG: DNA protecting protein DprA [Candidatus Woesebacteria bacterium RIFCSPHIGHO2_12_FULL_40_20]OGM66771.1 MAG: DNA protecting protein DprA [Candidatus Woesebacteria bacterium RIFCSPLOWO2_01_FULL_39_61]OGM74754.1 MAG: DNA protecting protein DprA [Candidatus Woesebacteria bacterium 
MNEKEYLISLYSYLPFGPVRIKLLISYFGSAKKVWLATQNELTEVGLKLNTAVNFVEYRENFDPSNYFKKIKSLGIKIITYSDSSYPNNLQGLDNAPLVLYVRGSLPDLTGRAVAIVGSRKMTSYGRETAYKLASELANVGVVIISGLAFGVDSVSHQAALDAGGITIAILASGVDIVTPTSNSYLARKIIDGKGALISEYPLGTQPLKTYFPNRNRIIAGLSNGVVVIEGAQKSGTYHTVNAAAGYGKTVFAVPGPIYSPSSEFPNFLIKNGAKMVTSIADITQELHMNTLIGNGDISIKGDTYNEKKLLEILVEPLHLDEIVRISTLKVHEVSATLTVMELKGMIKSLRNGVYKKV